MSAAFTPLTDPVFDLLRVPFLRRSFVEKKKIISKGRPTPKLDGLTKAGKGFVRHFAEGNYDRYDWLTASTKRNKLFCWPCLLFNTSEGTWNSTGFKSLNSFTKAAIKHQASVRHLTAVVHLMTFGESRVDLQLDDQWRRDTSLHNEKVKKNRDILKRLIDCVIFLGQQELSFRGHDERKVSLNRGNYLELLSLLSEYDADLRHHLATATVFTGTSGKIQNDLINSVAEVLNDAIKKEINNTKFIAVMVDETTDFSNSAQLSFILRYVTDMGVKERFLKFEDVTEKKGAHDLAASVLEVLDSYDCKTKLVAQCYDGAAVIASGLNCVQARVKEVIPQALFVHCYAHTLNLVMSQGASKIKDCKIFFANLGGLSAFFTRSPKHTKLLDEFCERWLPRVSQVRWNFNSRLVGTVHDKRAELVTLFQHILDHAEDFDRDTVHCASGHLSQLKSFDFCFFLFAFISIFDFADVLFGILQNKNLDVQFTLARIADFYQILEDERGKFDAIYERTAEAAGQPSAARGQTDVRAPYRQLHTALIDSIITQIRNRFEDHKRLLFVALLDAQLFAKFKQTFPEAELRSLDESYGAKFDLGRLRAELKVMYSMTNFQGKSPSDLLKFLRSTGLAVSMSQLYALTHLIMTIPVSTPSVERSFSALKRIKTYSRNTTEQTRLSALASIAIEKELLIHLKQDAQLHEEVIERFIGKDRRMDFIYK